MTPDTLPPPLPLSPSASTAVRPTSPRRPLDVPTPWTQAAACGCALEPLPKLTVVYRRPADAPPRCGHTAGDPARSTTVAHSATDGSITTSTPRGTVTANRPAPFSRCPAS